MPASVDDEASSKTDLVSAFNKIDVDGSGSVSKEVLWSRNGEQSSGVSKEDFDVLFEIIDRDKNGSVDFAEYSLFVEQLQKIGGGKRRRKSSLKVPTLKDSISSCNRPTQKQKKHDPRSSRLLSVHLQSAFRTKKLDLDQSNSKATTRRPNSVRFFDVEVREYGIAVSDNPGVRAGVALELSWEYNVLERDHLDTFEARRSKERSKDFKKEKKLTRLEREKILHEFGATPKEIQDASKRAATIRNKRKKSISMRQHDKFYEDVENSVSLFKRLFRKRDGKSQPRRDSEIADLERLHPTLMAMMGIDDASDE